MQGQISPARARSTRPTERPAPAALGPACNAPLASLTQGFRHTRLPVWVLVGRSRCGGLDNADPTTCPKQARNNVSSLCHFAAAHHGQRADLRIREATLCYCVSAEFVSPN